MQWLYYALNPWLVPWYYLLELIKSDTVMVIPLDGLIGQLLGNKGQLCKQGYRFAPLT